MSLDPWLETKARREIVKRQEAAYQALINEWPVRYDKGMTVEALEVAVEHLGKDDDLCVIELADTLKKLLGHLKAGTWQIITDQETP